MEMSTLLTTPSVNVTDADPLVPRGFTSYLQERTSSPAWASVTDIVSANTVASNIERVIPVGRPQRTGGSPVLPAQPHQCVVHQPVDLEPLAQQTLPHLK